MKSLMSCNCWSPQSVPAGRLLVDLGCGNGKYLGLHDSSQKYELGGDFSLNLLHILTSRGLEGRGYFYVLPYFWEHQIGADFILNHPHL